MRFPTSKTVMTVSSILLAASSASAQSAPSPTVVLKALTYKGCFSSSQPLEDQGSYTFQSAGYCQGVCADLNKAVMGTTKGSNCWCGDLLPAASSKVSDSECSSPCNGYNPQNCGGQNTWSISLTGTNNSVGSFGGSSAAASSGSDTNSQGSPSATKSQSLSVVTQAGQTIVVTASAQAGASSSKSSSSGGPSKAGIAAGVVVGVIAFCAIIGGVILFVRARRRRAVEDEYRRQAVINNFVGGGKPRKSATEGSNSDSRLDPSIMAHRRQSDGSIADERDFSRRILQVTNPDGQA